MKKIILLFAFNFQFCLEYPDFNLQNIRSNQSQKPINLVLSYEFKSFRNEIADDYYESKHLEKNLIGKEFSYFSEFLLNRDRFPNISLNSENPETNLYAHIRYIRSGNYLLFLTLFSYYIIPASLKYNVEVEMYFQTKTKKSKVYKSVIPFEEWYGWFPLIASIWQDRDVIMKEILSEAINDCLLQIEKNEPEFF